MTEHDLKPLTSEDMPELSVYVLTRFDDLTQTSDPTEIKEIFEDFIAFAPDLARAVIDLTAKVERVEALANRLEREAGELNGYPSGLAVHAGGVKERTVARIRAALIGETR